MKEILRSLRLESGLTQKQLAKIINSSDKNIWNYEKGLAFPPYEILIAYADYFGVTIDYLLGRTDEFGTRIPAVPAGAAKAMGDTITAQERELLNKFRELSPGLKEVALITLRSLAGEEINENELRFKIRK